MKYDFYQVDAFTSSIFGGNPACVVPLEKWLSDTILLSIAKENAVSETAFFVINGEDIHLRWFTPDIEIDLCGHATLATAYVLKSILKYSMNEISFHTISGIVKVNYFNNKYYLNFPARIAKPAKLPNEIKLSLSVPPKEIYKSRDYMLVYDSQHDIENLVINRNFFDKIDLGYGGVIVTSRGKSVDFVSRYFTPQATILEDPVTGSAHCTLIPYWSSQLKKKALNALQLSSRGGQLICEDKLNRVIIGGDARLYSVGKFMI
tara:strand:+ start:955 stop:1740 length:786 start_codon:yes stop_codon:yes gene_type:complete